MTTAAIIAIVALLSGFAHYEYKSPGCEVSITSIRVMRSANLTIDEDCNLSAGTTDMTRVDSKPTPVIGGTM